MPPAAQESGGPPVASVFSADHVAQAYPLGVERHWWSVARNRIVRRELVRAGAEEAPVLEIGCGSGVVTGYLASHGFDIAGCELADGFEPARHARESVRLGCDAFELAEPERSRYQTVLLLDVLEHLEDPAAMLRRVRESFGSLRRVLITVPGSRRLWSNYDEHYGHYRRYDRGSLRELASSAGFACRRDGWFFHALWPAAAVMAAVGARRSVTISAPGPLSSALHGVIGRAFDLEQRVAPRRLVGSSVFGLLEPAP